MTKPLRVRCALHKIDLVDNRCPNCAEKDRESYQQMQAQHGSITVSCYPGYMHSSRGVLVGSGKKPVPYQHPTSYIEYGVPLSLERPLNKMIDKAVAEHAKRCMCYTCQLARHNKKRAP